MVVLAVRADFYGRLASFSELAATVQGHQALVGPMTADDSRRAIEQPAAEAGLALEPGLADTVLEDLGQEPGALPLLSHALLETWKRRRGHTLTIAGYRESGGVRGAIAQTAEAVVTQLDPDQQAIARDIFLSLTEVGEGTEPTRRPVARGELVSGAETGSAIERVIEVLAEARLVTVGEHYVEVTHEALIRHWPTLRRWLDESRESLRLHRRLTQAAQEWDALARDPGALYRGGRLAGASEWAGEHDAALSGLEREFLQASRAAEQSEFELARRRTRRLRALALGLAALVLVAGASAVLALRAADRADSERRIALSQRLATQALARLDQDFELAAVLGLEAYRVKPVIEARSSVLSLLPRLEGKRGALGGHTDSVSELAFSPDGRTLASAGAD